MKIEVNVKKSYLFAVIGALVLIVGGFFVYAYGTSNPVNFGHTVGEIDGLDSYIIQIINENKNEILPKNCILNYSSKSITNYLQILDIPVSCLTYNNLSYCNIRVEEYTSTDTLVDLDIVQYIQSQVEDVLWSNQIEGSNGYGMYVTKNYGSASNGLYVLNHFNANGNTPDKIVVYDNNPNYLKLYFCD